ncbi:DUF6090 family protein [Aestuariibaculum sediminum]|uniref:Uncharacterized protein n=1 Tax=Aestuariibaculum sediminum TaxID=2770637 RepID=A0A8J6Q0E1_9FLAO|nr:DUF6090 family protein [Aestuariibaculum sediminum]MBD0832417.1 hypothetical protein [Aestuariibaculum sediminum]
MIKFFRNIRKTFINEGKTTKYIKYAIGEIVLVVIGILIALQINNWNEISKEKQLEALYLKNMLNDLKDQKNSIETQIDYEKSFFKASNTIIKNYQQDNTLKIDSMFFKHATILASRKTFIITDPTYTDLISSGNINVLKNVEFKKRLINYYQELKRIEKVIHNNNALLVDQNYLFNYNKIGYWYEPNIIEYDSTNNILDEGITIQNYQTELQDLSKKQLLKGENKLVFMNAIYLRNTIALGNFEFLKEIQYSTQSLITDLKKLNND